MNLYPLLMQPFFRHGAETPWGGHLLREKMLKDAPEGAVGESLEVSALPAHESRVANGAYAGEMLSAMLARWGEALSGLPDGTFPLLLKLLDAAQPLSVQVHPGDAYARIHEGKPGKSEAWVVLDAVPGAKIVYGVNTGGEDLQTVVAEGRLEACLRWQAVRPGEVYYIPSGTVHALGPGIQCYEIQQPSDTTYRFWDWGRPRELHTQKALDVAVSDRKFQPCPGVETELPGGRGICYICDDHFELWRLKVSGRLPLTAGRLRLLTPLGPCRLSWAEGALALKAWDSVVIPAALDGAALQGSAEVLLSATPDRAALKRLLGKRADRVEGI